MGILFVLELIAFVPLICLTFCRAHSMIGWPWLDLDGPVWTNLVLSGHGWTSLAMAAYVWTCLDGHGWSLLCLVGWTYLE